MDDKVLVKKAQLEYLSKMENTALAYQDTELTIEQVQELADAQNEGRLVALPCKVGDTVWCINYNDCEDEYCVEGYIFVAANQNYVICSSSYFGYENNCICETLLEEQAEDGNVEMYIFKHNDVFSSKAVAEKAKEGLRNA